MTPTRELAFQIAEQFRVLGTGINLKQTVIVGGMDMMQQAIELSKRPHIVVATPGRLVDHIRSSSNDIHFKRVKFLVLDEADRMLDDTFAKDLEVILKEIPKKRQNLLFSATMTPDIEQLQFSDASKPLVYQCCDRYAGLTDTIRHVYNSKNSTDSTLWTSSISATSFFRQACAMPT